MSSKDGCTGQSNPISMGFSTKKECYHAVNHFISGIETGKELAKGVSQRRNLTQYSDDELSLSVFNEEYFYIERKHTPYLMALINEEFTYTPAQMSVLVQDLKDDME